ncbi:MAG: nitrite reductase small subunit NirD [Actinomycetota bacterium]
MTAEPIPEFTHEHLVIAEEDAGEDITWVTVCQYEELIPERGVAALIAGEQIAILRLADGTVRAVGHHDPFSDANVIARGIVGTRVIDEVTVPTIASPVYKQVFDLRTGQCLDGHDVSLPTWPVEVVDGSVRIAIATATIDP